MHSFGLFLWIVKYSAGGSCTRLHNSCPWCLCIKIYEVSRLLRLRQTSLNSKLNRDLSFFPRALRYDGKRAITCRFASSLLFRVVSFKLVDFFKERNITSETTFLFFFSFPFFHSFPVTFYNVIIIIKNNIWQLTLLLFIWNVIADHLYHYEWFPLKEIYL